MRVLPSPPPGVVIPQGPVQWTEFRLKFWDYAQGQRSASHVVTVIVPIGELAPDLEANPDYRGNKVVPIVKAIVGAVDAEFVRLLKEDLAVTARLLSPDLWDRFTRVANYLTIQELANQALVQTERLESSWVTNGAVTSALEGASAELREQLRSTDFLNRVNENLRERNARAGVTERVPAAESLGQELVRLRDQSLARGLNNATDIAVMNRIIEALEPLRRVRR